VGAAAGVSASVPEGADAKESCVGHCWPAQALSDAAEITSLPIYFVNVILRGTGNPGERLMSIDQRIQAKRREILRIAAAHGARNVRVFGSAARGESGPDSDVDFLVAVQPEHSPWFPAGLIVDLEQLLGCEVDVVTEEALHWYIHDRVLKEAVPL
jgi:predicted nucleotidyltransferase